MNFLKFFTLGPLPPGVFNFDETNHSPKSWRMCRANQKLVRVTVVFISISLFVIFPIIFHSENVLFRTLAISAMWYGNELKILYNGWATGGILKSTHSATEPGWFDSYTFHLWFHFLFPALN